MVKATLERCPTCGAVTQDRSRPLNKGMVVSLGLMVRYTFFVENWSSGPLPWIHVPTVCLSAKSREEHKLPHWGLIEEERRLRPDGGRAGYWRLTTKGILFAAGEIKVPRYALVGPHNRLVRLEGEPWGIDDAYGKPFDLREI